MGRMGRRAAREELRPLLRRQAVELQRLGALAFDAGLEGVGEDLAALSLELSRVARSLELPRPLAGQNRLPGI